MDYFGLNGFTHFAGYEYSSALNPKCPCYLIDNLTCPTLVVWYRVRGAIRSPLYARLEYKNVSPP